MALCTVCGSAGQGRWSGWKCSIAGKKGHLHTQDREECCCWMSVQVLVVSAVAAALNAQSVLACCVHTGSVQPQVLCIVYIPWAACGVGPSGTMATFQLNARSTRPQQPMQCMLLEAFCCRYMPGVTGGQALAGRHWRVEAARVLCVQLLHTAVKSPGAGSVPAPPVRL
jgi:hypothetical protein